MTEREKLADMHVEARRRSILRAVTAMRGCLPDDIPWVLKWAKAGEVNYRALELMLGAYRESLLNAGKKRGAK